MTSEGVGGLWYNNHFSSRKANGVRQAYIYDGNSHVNTLYQDRGSGDLRGRQIKTLDCIRMTDVNAFDRRNVQILWMGIAVISTTDSTIPWGSQKRGSCECVYYVKLLSANGAQVIEIFKCLILYCISKIVCSRRRLSRRKIFVRVKIYLVI